MTVFYLSNKKQMSRKPDKNSFEYKIGLHIHQQGYQVRFADYDNDGNIGVLLKKGDQRRVVRIQYYPNKNEKHMGNYVEAMQNGIIGKDYFITDNTPKYGRVHVQTIMDTHHQIMPFFSSIFRLIHKLL